MCVNDRVVLPVIPTQGRSCGGAEGGHAPPHFGLCPLSRPPRSFLFFAISLPPLSLGPPLGSPLSVPLPVLPPARPPSQSQFWPHALSFFLKYNEYILKQEYECKLYVLLYYNIYSPVSISSELVHDPLPVIST